MSDVRELVRVALSGSCECLKKHPEAAEHAEWCRYRKIQKVADALETLARDNRELVQHCAGRLEAAMHQQAERWHEKARADAAGSRLAKLAPVVEAAREEVASGLCQSIRLKEALAKMEAANV